MADLIYSALQSLDGYIADENGNFDWAEPDEEVHTFVNELQRTVGSYLVGRRLYEVMAYWETIELAGQPAYIREFAELWRAADKIVYSTSLEKPSTARTRIERAFNPAAVQTMKASGAQDLAVGGAELAANAFKAGLVDELQLFLAPVVVGGGTRSLPRGVRLDLDLLEERRFGNGVTYLRYRTRA